MILYSAVTGVSLGALFLAGAIPGIILGLSQMLIIAYLARRARLGTLFRLRRLRDHPHRKARHLLLRVTGHHCRRLGDRRVYADRSRFVCRRLRPGAGDVPFTGGWTYGTSTELIVNAVQLTGELLIIVSLSFALGAGLTNAHVPEALVRNHRFRRLRRQRIHAHPRPGDPGDRRGHDPGPP